MYLEDKQRRASFRSDAATAPGRRQPGFDVGTSGRGHRRSARARRRRLHRAGRGGGGGSFGAVGAREHRDRPEQPVPRDEPSDRARRAWLRKDPRCLFENVAQEGRAVERRDELAEHVVARVDGGGGAGRRRCRRLHGGHRSAGRWRRPYRSIGRESDAGACRGRIRSRSRTRAPHAAGHCAVRGWRWRG